MATKCHLCATTNGAATSSRHHVVTTRKDDAQTFRGFIERFLVGVWFLGCRSDRRNHRLIHICVVGHRIAHEVMYGVISSALAMSYCNRGAVVSSSSAVSGTTAMCLCGGHLELDKGLGGPRFNGV